MKKKIFVIAVALLLAAGGSFVLKGVSSDSSLFDANIDALARPMSTILSHDLNDPIWELYYPDDNKPDHNCRVGGSQIC